MMKTTLYLTVFSFLYSFIMPSLCNGALLVWNKNAEDDLAGYNVYYGKTPRKYSGVVDVWKLTEYDFSDLKEGFTYYMAVTAYDHSKNESNFSSEVGFFADDGIPYSEDNCPDTYNYDQKDSYPPGGNGVGNACECEADFNGNGSVDAIDVSVLLREFSRNDFTRPCTKEDPCISDLDCNRSVDAYDISPLLEDFGRSAFTDNPCPDHERGVWCNY